MQVVLKNAGIFRNPFSAGVTLALFLLIVALRMLIPFSNIISWDVFGYYLYLPAIFIHHDLALNDLSWVYQLIDQYQNTSTLYQCFQIPEGGIVMKYSCGMAVMYSPFFLAAHWLAPHLGYVADGLSMPYQVAMAVAGLMYSLLGLVFLRKFLLNFFTDKLTAYLLVIIIAGTNYFQQAFEVGLLTHNVLFTLYGAVLILTLKWHEKPTLSGAAGLGFTIGLITLIRPVDFLVVLIPLLWNVSGWKTLREKMILLVREQGSLAVFLLALVLAGMPQLLYWKYVTGKFLYYSYINPGEGFDFLSPHTLDFLFSFRKGWLLYTPMMWLALAGLWVVYKRKRAIFPAISIFLLLYIYMVSSWSCWYYAGSFSQRPMVQVLPLLAIPLGFLIKEIKEWKTRAKAILHGFILLFLLLNLFQTWQYSFAYILDPYRMAAPYYWRIFGKTSLDLHDRDLLLVERSAEVDEYFTDSLKYERTRVYLMDFEQAEEPRGGGYTDSLQFQGEQCLRLDSSLIYTPAFRLKYKELTRSDHAWLRISVWVYAVDTARDNPFSLVATFSHRGGSYKYRAKDIKSKDGIFRPATWNYLSMDYMTPEVRNTSDSLLVYGWLRGKTPVWIDNLKLEVFEAKP